MKYILKVYNIWEQGPREKQEDSIYPKYGKQSDEDRLFILCDGMGGHDSGEVASSTVCEAMSDAIHRQCPDAQGDFSDENFNVALDEAFKALDKADTGAQKKMGTTLTFLKLHSQGCTIAHMGDSRVYHIRPGKTAEDTEILFHTIDHSYINDLLQIGEITEEEAKVSKHKNIITRAMQPMMERRPKADLYHSVDIRPGDYFFMCSDGIMEQMDDDNLRFIFSEKGGDSQNKVNIITQVTSKNHDNHSAIIVRIDEVTEPISIEEKRQPRVEDIGFEATPEFDSQISEEESSADEVLVVRETAELSDPRIITRPTKSSQSGDKVKMMKWVIVAGAAVVMLLCGYFLFLKPSGKESGNKPNKHIERPVEQKEKPTNSSSSSERPNQSPAPSNNNAREQAQQNSASNNNTPERQQQNSASNNSATERETSATTNTGEREEPNKEDLQEAISNSINPVKPEKPISEENKPEADKEDKENVEEAEKPERNPVEHLIDNLRSDNDQSEDEGEKEKEDIPTSDQDIINGALNSNDDDQKPTTFV